MKSPEEILKMTAAELDAYKWSEALNKKIPDVTSCLRCSDCFRCFCCTHCSDCFNCFNCFRCSYCYMCRNAKDLKWAICNVEVGEEAFKKKMEELGVNI